MKKLYPFKALALALLVGFTSASCSDDDEDSAPGGNNTIEYNGTSYTLKSGVVEDYGTIGAHYNYDFLVSDGTINSGANSISNAKIFLFAELLSPTSSAFQTGTFTYVQDASQSQHNSKHVFEGAGLVVDANNDNRLDQSDQILAVTGGTITVSGSNNKYDVTYDLTLSNGKTVKGKYNGDFTYVDER